MKLKRVFKWGCLTTVILLLAVGGFVWHQISRLRDNLEVETPLPIAEVKRDPGEVDRLKARIDRAQAEQIIRLRDIELTYIAQRALKHPQVQAQLDAVQAQAVAAVRDVPDPVGFLKGLRLDAVDLDQARVDVRVTDSQINLRVTAPYRGSDGFFNLQTGLTGGWAPGAVRLQVTRLQVGDMDVMALPFYPSLIESRVDAAVAQMARLETGGPISDVRVEANAVIVRLRPGGAAVLHDVVRRFLR